MAAAYTYLTLQDRFYRAFDNVSWRKRKLRRLLDENNVFKNISEDFLGFLIDERKKFVKKYRADTLFDYKINYSLKGCENKFIKLQNDSVYLTVTNVPELRYLDLPVYGFNLNKHYQNMRRVPDMISEQHIRDHYLIDYKSSCNDKKLETFSEALLSAYISDVREVLSMEYENNELLSLLMSWDARRFEKFLDHYLRGPQFMNSYKLFYILVTILERNSTDSQLIAESFRKMCKSCTYRNFSSFLPANCIHFMLKHLKLSAKGPEHFGQHHEWLSAENLVVKKFYRGDKSSLKLLLRYNCPTIFHPSYADKFFCRNFAPDSKNWPRQAAGCTSFNSSKYSAHLTCLTMYLYHHNEVYQRSSSKKVDITNCIRLLWASLPTPIIPIADIQEFLASMNERANWRDLDRYLRYFPREYPTDVYKPRSLQHLSRCAFLQNCHNPEGISSLHLPEKLKGYLKLDICKRKKVFP